MKRDGLRTSPHKFQRIISIWIIILCKISYYEDDQRVRRQKLDLLINNQLTYVSLSQGLSTSILSHGEKLKGDLKLEQFHILNM